MSIVIGPDGSLVNTSNVGSQFIPNITPNIGALANVASLGGSLKPLKTKTAQLPYPT